MHDITLSIIIRNFKGLSNLMTSLNASFANYPDYTFPPLTGISIAAASHVLGGGRCLARNESRLTHEIRIAGLPQVYYCTPLHAYDVESKLQGSVTK